MQLPANLTPDTIQHACERQMAGLDDPGFCMACGAEHDACEPDLREAACENCGEAQVYGAEELILHLV